MFCHYTKSWRLFFNNARIWSLPHLQLFLLLKQLLYGMVVQEQQSPQAAQVGVRVLLAVSVLCFARWITGFSRSLFTEQLDIRTSISFDWRSLIFKTKVIILIYNVLSWCVSKRELACAQASPNFSCKNISSHEVIQEKSSPHELINKKIFSLELVKVPESKDSNQVFSISSWFNLGLEMVVGYIYWYSGASVPYYRCRYWLCITVVCSVDI